MCTEILTDSELEFNGFEQWCFDLGMAYAREECKQALEQLDLHLMKSRDKEKLRNKGIRPLTIKTLMGEVTINRRMYQHTTDTGSTVYTYLLDEAIGLDTIGNMSINLIMRMANEITEKSYRSTADGISYTTGQSVSHTGVWNAIQSLGGAIKKLDECRATAAKNFQYEGERSISVLQEEYDGVWINMQGKDRPKKGRQSEMKVSVTYEGTEISGYDKKGKALHKRIEPLFMVGFENTKEFFEKKEGQLQSRYNLDEVTDRIINGDGGKWIKSCEEMTGGNTYFQLDPFHIKQALLKSGLPKQNRSTVNKLLKAHKINDALSHIEECLNRVADGKQSEKIEKMYKYLLSHKNYLVPIRERNIDALNDCEKVLNTNMGTAENAVGSVIALRMKKRRASFTKEGATNLGRLLALKRSNLLDETIGRFSEMILPAQFETLVTTVLSAASSPKHDGKGFNYPCKGSTPFDGQFTTNGRNSIRRMLSNRSYSELIYR
jgi:hypothetical protein